MTNSKTKHKGIREIFSKDEISLIDLVRLFTDRFIFILVSIGIFFVMGILIALTSPIEYQTEVQVLSETEAASSGSGLAGLAQLAGVPMSTGGGTGLSLDMYPAILDSRPFLIDLMEEQFYFQEKGTKMSLREYFLELRRGHLFSKVFGFLRGIPSRFFALFEREKEWSIPESTIETNGDTTTTEILTREIINVSREQRYVMDELKSRITIEAKGRIVTVSAKMPEPYVCAELNNIVLDRVIQYVIAYKTDKQRANLDFIEERTLEAEKKFKEAQLNLARFRDANQRIVTQIARTKEEQLQAEYNLAFNIYSALAQELEQTKIDLKKETPLFTEFEPVTVPLVKSEPSVPGIMITYMIFGILVGGLGIVFSIIWTYYKEGSKMEDSK